MDNRLFKFKGSFNSNLNGHVIFWVFSELDVFETLIPSLKLEQCQAGTGFLALMIVFVVQVRSQPSLLNY
jgi:hypothetical protein